MKEEVQERTVTKFLWLPFILKGKFNWLANVQIVERKETIRLSFWYGPVGDEIVVWVSDRFV